MTVLVPHAPPVVPDPRAEARLTAFRLVEAVQVGGVGDAIETRLAEAELRGWSDVARVLLYAAVVRAFIVKDPDLPARIDELQERAEAGGDSALLAAALASRAEATFATGSEGDLQQSDRELANATALLRSSEGRPMELATGYIACAVAYGHRELWELAEELYAEATPLLADCELPMLVACVLFNRAEANVRLMCGLAEMDRADELGAAAPVARRALEGARAGPLPPSWAVEVAVMDHLVASLSGTASSYEAAWLEQRACGLAVGSETTCGMLRLADAVRAARAADWASVSADSRRAATLCGEDDAAQARALALKLAAQAETITGHPGNTDAARYARYSARRRWQIRLHLVGSARASLLTEQLRLDRDRHARAALVDELTGLSNRRGYTRHLRALRALPHPNGLAVLLVDIDEFKAVNDTHGHPVGDEVLAQIGETLAAGIRPRDLVARLGGDEFVVLLDDFGADAARRRALDLQRRLTAVTWDSVSPGLRVSVSIGVAAGSPGHDPEMLVRLADTALYAAKALGGDRVELQPPGAG